MFILFFAVAWIHIICGVTGRYLLDYNTPEHCIPDYHFDTVSLMCVKCGSDRGQEKLQIASGDGLSCHCRPLHRLTAVYSSTKVSCEQCPVGQVTSSDGWSCVTCTDAVPIKNASNTCGDCSHGIFEETTGQDGDKQLSCTECPGDTWPNIDRTRCVRCPDEFRLANTSFCSCPADKYVLTGGTCIPRENLLPNADSAKFVKYSGSTFPSRLFQSHFQAALHNCKVHGNETACQVLANFCVLQLYDRDTDGNACWHYLKLGDSPSNSRKERPPNAPWLFYLDDDASSVVYRTDIPNEFTIKPWKNTSYIYIIAGTYSVQGNFCGLRELNINEIMLCNLGLQNKDILRFGTAFSHKCHVDVRELWDNSKTVFYDLFLQSNRGTWHKFYPIPVKIANIEHKSRRVNTENDPSSWHLVRRFFVVDVDAGVTAKDNSSAKFLRYAKDINIHITLYNKHKPGSIYPPFVTITYAEVTRDAYERNAKLPVSFSITYSANQSQAFQDISVALGVLSALAVLWACSQTWSWSRRSGKSAVSVTQQDVVHLFLPTMEQERTINTYIIFAFLMKTLQLIHSIAMQSSVDIFFLDWERPHVAAKPRHHGGLRLMRAARKEASKLGSDDGSQVGGGDLGDNGSSAKSTGVDTPTVTIWRSYFIANEWCELQTYRRISLPLQLLFILFFLKVIGLEYIALATPESYYSRTRSNFDVPFSSTCRFTLAAAFFLLIAAFQIFIHKVVYERFFENKMQHFVDLCSVSNISMFIFVQPKFGYYIHGRSAQGQADVSMKEMHELLRREEEDLCGHRGLLPDTDQQTFQMTLPSAVFEQYRRLRKPLTTYSQGPDRMQIAEGHLSRADIETVVNTYAVITKFLSAFIDHSVKELDYTVKDRALVEKLLDIELHDGYDRAAFYNDSGYSFGAVIYHGLELTLLLFDLLLFCVIDLACHDFVLAAALTLCIDKVIQGFRQVLGRRNLVKKALVDERFLW
ncbi:meckelin-like isoform X2 [Ornithodoros turicata]|uniref:meckelin-like isoform X2 n=1 Tax=Ornithodoros turicata TaxID=34597 RepID=UPI0031386E6C